MKFLQNLDKLAKMYDDVQNELGKGKGSSSPDKRGGPAKIPLGVKPNDPEYAQKAATAVVADVRMFSGCKDDQTSADVHDVASFGLPNSDGAGGACTNALLKSVDGPDDHCTWISLLESMQHILKGKKFTQVPQLSTSRKLDLTVPFDIMKPDSRRHKSLLIGINYTGQQGALNGCHNDVEAMQEFIATEGYTNTAETQLVLLDDGVHQAPTAANIKAAFEWLVGDAQDDDSLFFHYSGHGGSQKDTSGDEADGFDETMVPLDFQEQGMITDDELFKLLIAPLPEGCELTVVMDCCHSGSILDLPFVFVGTSGLIAAVEAGEVAPTLAQNPNFNLKKVLKVGYEMYQMYNKNNATPMQLGEYAAKSLGFDIKKDGLKTLKGLF